MVGTERKPKGQPCHFGRPLFLRSTHVPFSFLLVCVLRCRGNSMHMQGGSSHGTVHFGHRILKGIPTKLVLAATTRSHAASRGGRFRWKARLFLLCDHREFGQKFPRDESGVLGICRMGIASAGRSLELRFSPSHRHSPSSDCNLLRKLERSSMVQR